VGVMQVHMILAFFFYFFLFLLLLLFFFGVFPVFFFKHFISVSLASVEHRQPAPLCRLLP